MIDNRKSIVFNTDIKILSCACVGGKLEMQGPLGDLLDITFEDDLKQEGTWEKAESEMSRRAVSLALDKASLCESDIDIMFAGDLLNQCVGSAYGLECFDVPYFGLYGACSTFSEGIILASLAIESGHVNTAAVVASSHFCSAERQFRFPLEYGSFSGTCAQTTVTGAACVILSKANDHDSGIYVTHALPGIVCDSGIKDAANMGAAMSTAAADTILRFFKTNNTNKTDLIVTGDLGKEGMSITKDMLYKNGVDLKDRYNDCGLMIYDLKKQNVGCGGSGCGCSALVTCTHIYNALSKGEINSCAVVGTGAMMSKQSLLQGLSIPAVAHLFRIERK